MSDNIYYTCREIFYKVKHQFKYQYDIDKYGMAEHWISYKDAQDIGDYDFQDDCDGFAIMCRYFLEQQGLKCRLIVCDTHGDSSRGNHLICDCNGWLLDNRQDDVVEKIDLEDLGYAWVKISGYHPEDDWHYL